MIEKITIVSGNLFQVAAQYLGDATQWIRIAQLNRLSDPMIANATTLVLPSIDRTAGGGIVVQQ
jgi:hypothetical protein